MSSGKKRSGFQITSVTSDYNQSVGEGHAPHGPSAPETSVSQRDPGEQMMSPPGVFNGPAFQTQQSSSQPSTPVTVRKQSSLEQVGAVGGASRFRVVRLGQGLGEPYRRGRWTCVDVMEREAEERGLRRVIDSMRHAHSLESLETVGLGGPEGPVGGALLKPLSVRGLRVGHMMQSQNHSQQIIGYRTDTAHSGPPSPTHTRRDTHLLSPPHAPDAARPRKIPPPLRLDMDGAGMLRATRSQPASPGPHLGRDGLFHPTFTPVQTPSALALAQSMFGVGGAFELVTDESGSSNSMIAIDNKIEQAMDLVKAHLMLAVREEVEVLREQIKELAERNAQLERENYILRALRERH
ncbi:TSC22 domain family protein 4-like isoform X1 [Electrophorus electricus]|uniref:TSC22 domain family member 4 n=1 Tax=Electrophorus electricus TaxID=8005 RepID=A0AAY5EKD5_ELEEL|nr:TSC22 domain family protein 4-like isoform X1 [Electrophorus electricus]